MKNQLSGNVRSLMQQIFTPAAFACILGLSTLPLSARASENTTAKESPVKVKYLGKIDQQPVFQVNIDNAKEDEIYLTLKDDDGNVIYAEKFKDKAVSRKFQLNYDQINDPKFILSLSSKNDKKSETFEISNISRVVEDVVVTKVY